MSNMTRSLAMEWGPHGIRVNAIGPGFTLTDLAKPLWKDANLDKWRHENTPLRRMGYPEDMVGPCDLPGLSGRVVRHRAGPLRGRRHDLRVVLADPGVIASWAETCARACGC